MWFGRLTPWDAAAQTLPVSGARTCGCLGLQPQHWGVCVGVEVLLSWAKSGKGDCSVK